MAFELPTPTTVSAPRRSLFSSTSAKVDLDHKRADRRPFYAVTPESARFGRLHRVWEWARTRTGTEVLRRRISVRRVFLAILALAVVLYMFLKRKSTLVLSQHEIERVWRWELASGRYPSRRPTAVQLLGLIKHAENPGIPSSATVTPAFVGVGPPRDYLSVGRGLAEPSRSPHLSRPAPNAAIDLDVVMNDCDFSQKKYVRDCLLALRLNAGMDQGHRAYRNVTPSAFHIQASAVQDPPPTAIELSKLKQAETDMGMLLASDEDTFATLLSIRQRLTLSSFSNPPTSPHPSHPTADPVCDPDHPRIFHIYWAGPFTDKPYMAALSFLYTQRLGLSLPIGASEPSICRPQLWFWINLGDVASRPDPEAEENMRAALARNPWSAPLLHRRFQDSLKFRLWNTTEQLDAIPELKGWQSRSLFYSGGKTLKPKKSKKASRMLDAATENPGVSISKDDLAEESRLPHSIVDYDRLSVSLSDMVRFVLTFRFGGIYLDADTLFLRDWEELWNWRGAFGYRWSRLKLYNTAVLKMDRGSALGTAIFKTAAANFLDFHPMTMASYMRDAHMEELLLRLPDALFDPAWLNNERYQMDRPAFPVFRIWEDFFESPKASAGIPSAVGFTGFFRGAFSYHFHNNWWLAFDPTRNFPDLGPRFEEAFVHSKAGREGSGSEGDLSWATVLKRTFEKFVRGEAASAYGDWINWEDDD